MNHQSYMRAAGLIFLIVTLVHLWRVSMGYPATIGEMFVPVWASWVAIVVAAYMAYQGLKKR